MSYSYRYNKFNYLKLVNLVGGQGGKEDRGRGRDDRDKARERIKSERGPQGSEREKKRGRETGADIAVAGQPLRTASTVREASTYTNVKDARDALISAKNAYNVQLTKVLRMVGYTDRADLEDPDNQKDIENIKKRDSRVQPAMNDLNKLEEQVQKLDTRLQELEQAGPAQAGPARAEAGPARAEAGPARAGPAQYDFILEDAARQLEDAQEYATGIAPNLAAKISQDTWNEIRGAQESAENAFRVLEQARVNANEKSSAARISADTWDEQHDAAEAAENAENEFKKAKQAFDEAVMFVEDAVQAAVKAANDEVKRERNVQAEAARAEAKREQEAEDKRRKNIMKRDKRAERAEAAQLEAARVEAEQRRAEKAEYERVLLERIAAREEEEAARAEAARAEAARAEAARAEAARAEAAQQQQRIPIRVVQPAPPVPAQQPQRIPIRVVQPVPAHVPASALVPVPAPVPASALAPVPAPVPVSAEAAPAEAVPAKGSPIVLANPTLADKDVAIQELSRQIDELSKNKDQNKESIDQIVKDKEVLINARRAQADRILKKARDKVKEAEKTTKSAEINRNNNPGNDALEYAYAQAIQAHAVALGELTIVQNQRAEHTRQMEEAQARKTAPQQQAAATARAERMNKREISKWRREVRKDPTPAEAISVATRGRGGPASRGRGGPASRGGL